jgi:fatty-acyl-CoA synthase
MSAIQAEAVVTPTGTSRSRAWSRALELTASIVNNPHRLLPTVIEEIAERCSEAPALLSDREALTYGELVRRSNRYARWALEHGLARGDAVGLFMPNRPEYMAIWLGITSVGGVVGLLNTNLTGSSLVHCINAMAPRHLIVAGELVEALVVALPNLTDTPTIWVHGSDHADCPRIDREIERHTGDRLSDVERRPPTIEDRALYVYTSGTTGLPKAAIVSHARVMQWSHWFAGMMDVRAGDRMYNCLPMYHSVGGVLATGAVLVGGGSVVIRDIFSARQFWNDVARWDCTLFQYIGELCRYLLHTECSPHEQHHRIRLCCGNGLRPEVWNDFKARFRIPQILEFYAATEGNVSLFNVEGKVGAIGRLPFFLGRQFPAVLVKFDVEAGEPIRDDQGFCVPCAPNQVGEALGRIVEDRSNVGSRFDGYTSREASEQKILRNVFQPGDAWFQTGDLMRMDEKGFFYFVDRVGDTFRWKGENVSTSEVSNAIHAFPGVTQAIVYGVRVPGVDGRAGMATLVTDDRMDLEAFRTHLIEHLPEYARPLLLRVRSEIATTSTWKYAKSDFVRLGYDPMATADAIFFNDPKCKTFVRLDEPLYQRIQAGEIRF